MNAFHGELLRIFDASKKAGERLPAEDLPEGDGA